MVQVLSSKQGYWLSEMANKDIQDFSRLDAAFPTSQADISATRILSLDGLRGLAAVFVFMEHAHSEGLVSLGPYIENLGKIGVGLFYMLSGYLMAALYMDRDFNRKNVRNYLAARVARIVPLYYIAILVGLILLVFFDRVIFAFETAPQLLLNIGFIRGGGVLWSIPVEVHFYFMFLAIWAIYSLGRGFTMIWVILGAQAVFLTMYSDMLGNEHTIPFWAHYFILGILVQRFWDRLAVLARSLRGAASSVTCSICVIIVLVALLPGSRAAFGLDEFPRLCCTNRLMAGVPLLPDRPIPRPS